MTRSRVRLRGADCRRFCTAQVWPRAACSWLGHFAMPATGRNRSRTPSWQRRGCLDQEPCSRMSPGHHTLTGPSSPAEPRSADGALLARLLVAWDEALSGAGLRCSWAERRGQLREGLASIGDRAHHSQLRDLQRAAKQTSGTLRKPAQRVRLPGRGASTGGQP